MKTKRRPRMYTESLDILTVRVGARTKLELEAYAHKSGTNTSELGRWGWEYILRTIKRHRSGWLKRQIAERREADRESKRVERELGDEGRQDAGGPVGGGEDCTPSGL